MRPLRLALAQIDATRRRPRRQRARRSATGIDRARDDGAQLVLFPELALTGYPPEDLLLKTHFLRDRARRSRRSWRRPRASWRSSASQQPREDVYNALAVLADGGVQAVYRKMLAAELRRLRRAALLPGRRRGGGPRPRGRARRPDGLRGHLGAGPPATAEALAGASLIVNTSASPYFAGKGRQRERCSPARARQPLRRRVLQHGRRPGRAGLRRALGRARPRGRG